MPNFDRTVDLLETELQRTLPGIRAHREMAPENRQRVLEAPLPDNFRQASVLALLSDQADAPVVLLTRRRADLSDHAGQISFPGGRREPGEKLLDTALREAYEEVGVSRSSVRVLGRLTPIFVPPSNFQVTPFVAAATDLLDLTLSDSEVEEVIFAPLSLLADPAAIRRETWKLHGRDVTVPFYDIRGHQVWGATAMILAEVASVYRAAIQRQ